MNPSVLIFVALAVAWLAYLIPKALEHTEVAERTRGIVDFSHRLRILGRREPAGFARAESSGASDEVSPGTDLPAERQRVDDLPGDTSKDAPGDSAHQYVARTAAAKRRRNVLASLTILLFIAAVLAVFRIVPMYVAGGPVVLIVAWLVACRLMVRRERRPVRRAATPAATSAAVEETASVVVGAPPMGIEEDGQPDLAAADPDAWDPVAVPLPTYVAKPPAHRTVRTIDLDGTGVWSSGRNDADSALAREADAARQGEPTQEVRRKSS